MQCGRGVIDFKKIFAKADVAGIKHYLIEQDITPGDPFESIKISLEYLQRSKLSLAGSAAETLSLVQTFG